MSETRTSDASASNLEAPQIDLEAFRRRYPAHAAVSCRCRISRELVRAGA